MKLAAGLGIIVGIGCGGGSGLPDAQYFDSSSDAGFTAPHGPQPVVLPRAGGVVLAAPVVVPIFFTGDDTMQTALEGFFAALPGSAYWTAITSEYGISGITFATPIVTTDTVPTTDAELQAYVDANSQAGGAWPLDTPNTIYTVFLPHGAMLSTPFGNSCQAFGGYHDETQQLVVYALIPRCDDTLDTATLALSHELLEASTDPHVASNPAYVLPDPFHAIWGEMPGGELGDMCEYLGNAAQRLVGNYLVQRTWSNVAAGTNGDPCVPAPAGAYHGAEPVLPDLLPFDSATGGITTEGVQVPYGMSKTIDVVLFSDQPTDLWNVRATDADHAIFGLPPELELTWDRTDGSNGTTLHLTIERVANGQIGGNGSSLLIESTVAGQGVSEWWAYVGN